MSKYQQHFLFSSFHVLRLWNRCCPMQGTTGTFLMSFLRTSATYPHAQKQCVCYCWTSQRQNTPSRASRIWAGLSQSLMREIRGGFMEPWHFNNDQNDQNTTWGLVIWFAFNIYLMFAVCILWINDSFIRWRQLWSIWSHQVYKVLKKDSSEPLLEGKNPTPHAEIKFWKNRLVLGIQWLRCCLKSSFSLVCPRYVML